jgi:hypothetical protein
MTRLAKAPSWPTRILQIIIGVELVLGLVTCLVLVGPQLPPAIHMETNGEYLSRTLDIYPISQQINRRLPAKANILLLNETRGFYLDRPYLWGIGHNNLIPPQATKTPEALLAAMQQLGVTHLLIPKNTLRALDTSAGPQDISLRELITQGQLTEVLRDNKKTGFEVLAIAPD